MKNPLRTEGEAFSFLLVAGVVFLVTALAGVNWSGGVAAAVFGSLVLGIALGVYLDRDPKEREPAVWERRPDQP